MEALAQMEHDNALSSEAWLSCIVAVDYALVDV